MNAGPLLFVVMAPEGQVGCPCSTPSFYRGTRHFQKSVLLIG